MEIFKFETATSSACILNYSSLPLESSQGLYIFPLLSLPVNYSGLRAQIWLPCPPSFSLVCFWMRAFSLNTKRAFSRAGLSTAGFRRNMVAANRGQESCSVDILIYKRTNLRWGNPNYFYCSANIDFIHAFVGIILRFYQSENPKSSQMFHTGPWIPSEVRSVQALEFFRGKHKNMARHSIHSSVSPTSDSYSGFLPFERNAEGNKVPPLTTWWATIHIFKSTCPHAARPLAPSAEPLPLNITGCNPQASSKSPRLQLSPLSRCAALSTTDPSVRSVPGKHSNSGL